MVLTIENMETTTKKKGPLFDAELLMRAVNRKDLIEAAEAKGRITSVDKVLNNLKYEYELQQLQSELVNLQRWIHETKKRVVVMSASVLEMDSTEAASASQVADLALVNVMPSALSSPRKTPPIYCSRARHPSPPANVPRYC